MADPAQPEAPGSAPDIKQEPDLSVLEGLDFTLPPELLNPKRPFENGAEPHQEPDAKRLKAEEPEAALQPQDDNSLEDGLELLVQNALSGVDDLIPQFDTPVDSNSGDPMDIDAAALLESSTPTPTFYADPLKYVRNVQTHTLSNLSFTLLYSLVQHEAVDETIQAIRDAESDHGKTFRQLQLSLESVWKLFTSNDVMAAEDMNEDSNAATLLEIANLAKLCVWLVQGTTESYSIADSKFLSIFNCQVSDLPIDATELYLGIKTQNCIQQLINKADDQQAEQLVTQALTQGLGDMLKAQHPEDSLLNADQAFITLATVRKTELIQDTKERIDAESLKQKYPPHELLRNFAAYTKTRLAAASNISSMYGVHIHLEVDTMEHVTFGDLGGSADIDLDDLSAFFEKTASGLVQDALAGLSQVEALPSIVIDGPANSSATNETNGATNDTNDRTVPVDATVIPSDAHSSNGTNSTNDTNAKTGSNGSNGTGDTNGTNGTNAVNSTSATDKTATTTTNGTGPTSTVSKIGILQDYKELEALVAESTSNYVKTTLNGLSPVPYQPTVPMSTTESMTAQAPFTNHMQQQPGQHHYYNYTQPLIQEQPPPQAASTDDLPPNQSCSSDVLYDKARQAALSKSTSHTRREGSHSTRRPWTQEEEKCLMLGLDLVKGPHWSQILGIFGQNGTMSDVLKDRTQVQLKDKARNLKLFFLKTNSEMPFYLQAVTGELKTRAPTQAARKEAEERARMNSEEDQAKMQGIMALAGGLHHLPPGRPGAAGVGSGVVTPAQAASAAQAAQGRAGTIMSNIPKTVAATIAQARENMHPTTQQALQAMSQQNPPRPQSQAQFPPHVPRPQSQQQQQQQQQQHRQQVSQQLSLPSAHHPALQHQPPKHGNHHPQQQQQQQQQPHQPKPAEIQHLTAQQPPAIPLPHPIALPSTMSRRRSEPHAPIATASPAPPPAHNSLPQTPLLQQPSPTVQATSMVDPKEIPKPEEALSPEAQQQADNAADAAILEGLQAAVANSLV